MTDSEQRRLIAAVVAGDRKALRALYVACSPLVMGIALRILRQRADAEEIVQETFLSVWKRAETYDQTRGTAVSWIVTMARSKAIDRLRARQTALRLMTGAAQEPANAPVPPPLELAEQRQARERVAGALAQIPEEQRAAVALAYFDGLSQREIAEHTGQPLGTIKTRMRLGMEKLAALLAELRST